MPHLAVPAYFVDERDHARLLDARPRYVVLNPASGAGSAPCSRYRSLADDLAAVGTTVLWYVHLRYGRRPRAAVVDDLQRYVDWYGLGGVLFDEVPSDLDSPAGAAVGGCVSAAVDRGAATVALNPGTCPVRLGAVRADIVVTFEGTCRDYLSDARASLLHPAAAWRASGGRDWQEWHLVHSADPRRHARVLEQADACRAELAYVAAGTLPNPWDRLSQVDGYAPAESALPTGYAE